MVVPARTDPRRLILPVWKKERLDERCLSRPAVTEDGDVADLGGLGHGRSVLPRGSDLGSRSWASYADLPSSGGSSPRFEGETGSSDRV